MVKKGKTRMSMDRLKFISFNINGLLNPIKRKRVLSRVKKEQATIVYLQETHLNDTEHQKLQQMGYTQVFFSSYGLGHRRGVAILIANRLKFEKTFELKDGDGRYILVRGVVDGKMISLMNVYAPPGSEFDFYRKICNIMVTETKGLLACGGDLNLRLKPELDSSKW